MFSSRFLKIVLGVTVALLLTLFGWVWSELGATDAISLFSIGVLLLVFAVTVGTPIVIWFTGALHRKARLAIVHAANLTQDRKYSEARQEVQRAIQMNPAIASNQDAVSLYRIIVDSPPLPELAEVQRVRDAANKWLPTKWERMSEHPVLRVGVPLLWLAVVVMRLVELATIR